MKGSAGTAVPGCNRVLYCSFRGIRELTSTKHIT